MKSPFPGMDPFIEGCGLWGDFHRGLIGEIRRYLSDMLPDQYVVRAGEREYFVYSSDGVLVEEQFLEPYLTILEGPECRLVTCIEILSPSNKMPNTPGWDLYLRKRQELFMAKSPNFVEIDLLRGGQRMPMLDSWSNCRVWPAHFKSPLPLIPIPLLEPDPDLPLNLQPMVEAIYARSKYDRSIKYSKPILPPLSAEEAAWLEQQLRDRAKPA